MEQLWAPWRLSYAEQPKRTEPSQSACFICESNTQSDDRKNLVALRTDSSIVVLNRYPYTNGHLLVCPRSHKADLQELSDLELLDLQHVIVRVMGALRRAIQAEAFNLGLNLGRAAGAGVPGHLHWHVVPRWPGDTNFMPVIFDTKVIVQSLDSLYDALLREL